MEWLNPGGRIDLLSLDDVDFQVRLRAPGTPGPVQSDAGAAHLHDGRAGGVSGPGPQRDSQLPQHGRLGDPLPQVGCFIGQPPVVTGADDKIDSVLLAEADWFIEIRFPVGDIDPATTRWRSAGLLEYRRPAGGGARSRRLVASSALRPIPLSPALLMHQSDHDPFGPLLQVPRF